MVGQDHAEPSTSLEEEAETFPQWGIAVLVIGLAAIAFVVIFGVSMVGYCYFHTNVIAVLVIGLAVIAFVIIFGVSIVDYLLLLPYEWHRCPCLFSDSKAKI